jgi:MFS family permease
VGALGAGLATLGGVDFRARLSVTAAVLAVTAIWTAVSPPLRAQPGPAATETKISLSIFLRSRSLIVPAIVVLSAFFVEGSMDIWSVIYLRRTLEASALAGGIAFAIFSLAMAFGRITAGRVLFGLGYRATLRISGAGSLVAGLTAAITRSTVIAGVAFLFLGFFIASAAPAAFGMIAGTDEDPALAVAAMTTVGYSGFVVGPPLMGLLAERAGLRATMVVLVAMSLGVVAGGVFGTTDTSGDRGVPERLDRPGRGEA